MKFMYNISMSVPTISVIIPIYNTGSSAKKMIAKILRDQQTDLEVIAVDDGSTDDSLAKLRTLSHPRLKIYHQKNNGASSARNLGMLKAKGQYFIFIDSDDDISTSFITELYKSIQDPRVDLVVTGIKYKRILQKTTSDVYLSPQPNMQFNESRKAYILRLFNLDGRLYSSVNKIFRASIIRQHQLQFEEGIDFAEDTRFVLNYLKYAPGDIISIPKPLYIYNYGTTNSTVSKSSIIWRNWQSSYDFFLSWLGQSPTREELKQLSLLKFRWKISHMLAVSRSNLPLIEKLHYLNPFALMFGLIIKRFRP